MFGDRLDRRAWRTCEYGEYYVVLRVVEAGCLPKIPRHKKVIGNNIGILAKININVYYS
jgi:hypothetical protein